MIIKEDGLFNGKRLRACSDQARLYFPYYLVASNTLARLELDISVIRARCFVEWGSPPTPKEIIGHFEEYEKAGLCVSYEANGSTWVQWDVPKGCLPRHKKADDERSPAPPEQVIENKAFQKSAQSCESLRGSARGVGVGVGVGVGIGVGKPTPTASAGGQEFEEFWSVWPRKIAKKDAAKAFRQLNSTELGRLQSNLPAWLDELSARETSKIPYPATFIRRGQYADPPPRARSPATSGVLQNPTDESEWKTTIIG